MSIRPRGAWGGIKLLARSADFGRICRAAATLAGDSARLEKSQEHIAWKFACHQAPIDALDFPLQGYQAWHVPTVALMDRGSVVIALLLSHLKMGQEPARRYRNQSQRFWDEELRLKNSLY